MTFEELKNTLTTLSHMETELGEALQQIGFDIAHNKLENMTAKDNEVKKKQLDNRVADSAEKAIVKLISVLENAEDVLVAQNTNNPKPIDYWLDSTYLDSDEKLVLKAYYHIRHSAGHKTGGGRARGWKNDFNTAYSQNLLQGVTLTPDDKILMDSRTPVTCQRFLAGIVQKQLHGIGNNQQNIVTS